MLRTDFGDLSEIHAETAVELNVADGYEPRAAIDVRHQIFRLDSTIFRLHPANFDAELLKLEPAKIVRGELLSWNDQVVALAPLNSHCDLRETMRCVLNVRNAAR
ncbi:hypothetical protein D3C72_1700350 [compost metagenome]